MTAVLTAVLAIGALAGCTDNTTGGNPTTAPTNGGEQTSTQPTSGGSDSGLSIAKYVSKPCDVLTPAQITQLGSVKPGAQSTSSLGPLCEWNGADVIANSTYSVSVTQGKSVDDMVKNVSGNPVFKETKVDGTRFVTNSQTDGKIRCTTTVGLSDDESFTVQAAIASSERASKNGCDESDRVAKLIIGNLKG